MSHRLLRSDLIDMVSGTHHMGICNLGQDLDGSYCIAVFLRGSIIHGMMMLGHLGACAG